MHRQISRDVQLEQIIAEEIREAIRRINRRRVHALVIGIRVTWGERGVANALWIARASREGETCAQQNEQKKTARPDLHLRTLTQFINCNNPPLANGNFFS